MRSRHTTADAHVHQQTISIDEVRTPHSKDELFSRMRPDVTTFCFCARGLFLFVLRFQAIELVSGYSPSNPLSHAKSGPSDMGYLLDTVAGTTAISTTTTSDHDLQASTSTMSEALSPVSSPRPARRSWLDFAGIGHYQTFILLFCGWQWVIGSMCTLMPVFVEHSTHETKSPMPTSVAADWGLEGEKSYMLGILGSLFFLGWFLGRKWKGVAV